MTAEELKERTKAFVLRITKPRDKKHDNALLAIVNRQSSIVNSSDPREHQ